MRFFLILSLITFSVLPSFSQVKTIDVELQEVNTNWNLDFIPDNQLTVQHNSNSENTYVTVSEDDNSIFYFFQNKKNEYSFDLHILNKDFETTNKIKDINLGQKGENRSFFIKDNYLFRGVLNSQELLKGISSLKKFYFYKIAINKSNETKSYVLNLNGQKLLATKHIGEEYYIITINNTGKLVKHSIDLNTLAVTTKKFRGDISIYHSLNGLFKNDIGAAQIDNEHYTSLHAASSKIKSYFQNGKYILSYQVNNNIQLAMLDLKSDDLKKISMVNISNNHSSVVIDDKFYVVELDKSGLTLKVFKLETGKLLGKVTKSKEDSFKNLASTKISSGSFDGLLNRYKLIKKDYSSLGIIAQKLNDQTILTIGIPSYHVYYETYTDQNGNTQVREHTYKSNYKSNDIRLTYDEHLFFETWINANNKIIPYRENHDFQSTYFSVYRFLNVHNLKERFSDFTLFNIGSAVYFGCYDRELKKYMIYRTR